MTARNFELRIVFTHQFISGTLFLLLIPAVLTAFVLLGIPHALSVSSTGRFSGVTVLTLTLASRVGLALDTETRFTPSSKITSRIAERVSLEVQPSHVGDVKVNVLGGNTTRNIIEFFSSSSSDTISSNFVDANTINTSTALARRADISNTNSRTEGVVLTSELELESSVFVFSVGRELDGSRPGRAIHVVVSLRVDGVSTLSRGDTNTGEESADFRRVVGIIKITNSRIGSAVSVILLLFARLDTILLDLIPQTVTISHTRLFRVVHDTTRADAVRDTPVTSSIGVTFRFSRVITLGLTFTLSGHETTPIISTLLSRPITRRACIHTRLILPLTRRITRADGVVADFSTLTEAELTSTIPVAFLTVISFPTGTVVDVGEEFTAELTVLSSVIPEALGRLSTVSHESTARAVHAADIIVIPDTVNILVTLLFTPITVLTFSDTAAIFPITLSFFRALVLSVLVVSHFTARITFLVDSIPETQGRILGAAFLGTSTEIT